MQTSQQSVDMNNESFAREVAQLFVAGRQSTRNVSWADSPVASPPETPFAGAPERGSSPIRYCPT